jgi:hypothetical protein
MRKKRSAKYVFVLIIVDEKHASKFTTDIGALQKKKSHLS